MPELPEVENIKRQISFLQGYTITGITQSNLKLRYDLNNTDALRITQKEILDLYRLGRYILINLSDSTLLIHLGMTGSIRYLDEYIPKKHDHVVLRVTSKQNKPLFLIYNDPRRFGGLKLINETEKSKINSFLNLGLDPYKLLSSSQIKLRLRPNATLKSELMVNQFITGIGNIYASEICFDAQLSPLRRIKNLTKYEWETLTLSIFNIISRAILLGGSTFRNYVDANGNTGGAQQAHCVYGRAANMCPRCGSIIQVTTQLGRSTFFCENCQF